MSQIQLAAIMFTDIVSFSKMVRDDEQQGLELLEEHNALLTNEILASEGLIIKTIGDSFMVRFQSVISAVECAQNIQEKLSKRNKAKPDKLPIKVRIGIHLGDVVEKDGDVFGDGVNIASRIESISKELQILVSENVYTSLQSKKQFQFQPLGKKALKNIGEMEVYELNWNQQAVEQSVSKSRAPKAKRVTQYLKLTVAAVVTVTLVFLGFYFQKERVPATAQVQSTLQIRPSIVVFPFQLKIESKNFIDKILQDGINQKLYNVKELRVINPFQLHRSLSLIQYDSSILLTPSQLETLSKKLDARLGVHGYIQKIGDEYIISATLYDFNKSESIMTFQEKAQSEEMILNNVVDLLSDDILNHLDSLLNLNISNTTIWKPIKDLTTENLNAYKHFILGLDYCDIGDFRRGNPQLLKATEIDPEFAMAYSILSCNYSLLKDETQSLIYMDSAKQYEGKINGISKEALLFKGNKAWIDGNLSECEKHYKLITELYPDDRDGHFYLGMFFSYMKNDHTNAMKRYKRVLELTPGYYPTYREMAYTISKTEGTDSAVSFIQKFINEYKDNPSIQFAREFIVDLRNQ